MAQPCGAPAAERAVLRQVGLSSIAEALAETAQHLAEDLEGMELLAAKLPPTPGIVDTIDRLKLRAERVGIAHAYFKELAERPQTPVEITQTIFGPKAIDATEPMADPAPADSR